MPKNAHKLKPCHETTNGIWIAEEESQKHKQPEKPEQVTTEVRGEGGEIPRRQGW